MKAVIMAGGEGTRLRPLTCTVPKPLVKICGKTVVEYILDLLKKSNCEQATFTLRYKGEQIEHFFDKGEYKGIQLDFSYEDEPLGTAGCVKKAVKYDDDFIVISGDAMCDFNLTAALAFHKKVKADATIITKQVADPREYGLVLAENGIVTGFSEKPSYLSCVSDKANTGVYILSKKVVDIIPSNGMSDFAKDIFPHMLSKGMKLCCFEENGYWCDIGDLDSFRKCQTDILNGKCICEIPQNNADEAKYPDVIIRKPCFIGKNVSIGNGSVIEAGSVICDNTSIGAGCKIHNSVILDGSFISSRVSCNSTVIGENVKIGSNCGIYENSVIGDNCIIENSVTITPNIKIWPDKLIQRGSTVISDVKYANNSKAELTESGFYGTTNSIVTPDFVAKIGCSLSCINVNNIVISCDDNNCSKSLKNAFISGITSTGINICDAGELPVSMLIYAERMLNCSHAVHISSKLGTSISLFARNGLPLTRSEERKLEGGLNRGEYKTAPWDKFGYCERFDSGEKIYSAMLEKLADFHSEYRIIISCSNHAIEKALKPICEKISSYNGETLTVIIDHEGEKCEILCRDNKYSHDTLITLCCANIMHKGYDVAVPYSFPSAVDFIAESLGRYVRRFFSCSNDNSDISARRLAETEPFLFDGAILFLTVLSYLAENKIPLDKAVANIPHYVRENRFVEISVPPQQILSRINSGCTGIGEGVIINSDNDRVLLRSDKKGKGIFLFAESFSEETAKELCVNTEKLIKKLMSDKTQ